jgi:hypothetical protein
MESSRPTNELDAELFEKVANLDGQYAQYIRFRCTEPVRFRGKDPATDTDGHFELGGFYEEDDTTEAWELLANPAEVTLPRRSPCDHGHGAYVVNGSPGNNGAQGRSGQSVVVLCPGFFFATRDEHGLDVSDARLTTEIMADNSVGLLQDFYTLQSIGYQTRTILHELFHLRAVGGGKYSPR